MIMTESTTQRSDAMNKSSQDLYAEVHGLKLYYEIHGEGFPLVLLHGGLSTIGTSFGKVLPGLARERQVIAIEQADFFGYSIGGGIAMQIAIEHPSLVRKLVVATPISTADGF